MGFLSLSDSLPAAILRLSLSRCPVTASELTASLACTTKELRPHSSANITVVVSPTIVSMSCDGHATVPTALVVPSTVEALPVFRISRGMLRLECTLHALGGSPMGLAGMNVSVEPTLWPTFDDVLLIEKK